MFAGACRPLQAAALPSLDAGPWYALGAKENRHLVELVIFRARDHRARPNLPRGSPPPASPHKLWSQNSIMEFYSQ